MSLSPVGVSNGVPATKQVVWPTVFSSRAPVSAPLATACSAFAAAWSILAA